jgi:hypothetical protein
MCLLCVTAAEGSSAFQRRAYMLQLLALIEHPDALPADAALRLGRDILALAELERAALRCEAIVDSAPLSCGLGPAGERIRS